MLERVSTTRASAPLLVSVDGDDPVTWLVFCALNADAFDAGELELLRLDLERDGAATVGGGAAAEMVIRASHPADAEPCAFDAADRLLAAALASTVDLGDATACAVMLTSGPGGEAGLSWDALAAARAQAIRMVQVRVRGVALSASPAALRAALDEVEGFAWDRPEVAAVLDPARAVLRELLGLPADAALPH